jgi:hypothetical protein
MREIAAHYSWVETERVETERTDWIERVEGFRKTLWTHGWGLLFVVVMTLLAQYGPRTVYSKLPPAPPASEPAVHSIK